MSRKTKNKKIKKNTAKSDPIFDGGLNKSHIIRQENSVSKEKKIRILAIVKGVDIRLGSFFSTSGIGQVLLIIFTAGLIAIFSSRLQNLLLFWKCRDIVNELAIGMNEEYLLENIGEPVYVCTHDDRIDEEVFILKDCITRLFFENSKLIGFFVTALSDTSNYGTEGLVAEFLEGKSICKVNYEDIKGKPYHIDGYMQNGAGYIVYSEEYYYASSGYYNFYYFMYLDYGVNNNTWIDSEKFIIQDEIDDDCVDIRYYRPLVLRRDSYPNTYGVVESEYASKIYSYISDYSLFDFSKYRKQMMKAKR